MGDVASVYRTGGVLAYPEMKRIGDWDDAISKGTSRTAASA